MAPEKIDKKSYDRSSKSPVIYNNDDGTQGLRSSYDEESEYQIIPISSIKAQTNGKFGGRDEKQFKSDSEH